ncbi:APC membrane recruitment protein 2 [Syngnathus typhle]
MEVQTECADPTAAPPCDPQPPTGKINKAAFKLFAKRRTGSGMASFFSFRNKGATLNGTNGHSDTGNSVNGNASMSSGEMVRSKTHDGLIGSSNNADVQRGEGLSTLETGTVRSLSKSLSFFSLLRRGSLRSNENSAGLVRRGRGLKGFFTSIRWRRKDKTNEGDGDESEPRKEKDVDAAAAETAQDISLILEPTPSGKTEAECNLQAVEAHSKSVPLTATQCVAMPGPSAEPDSPSPYTPNDSPLHPATSKAKASVSSLTPSLATPPLECCSTGDPPSEPSVDRLCSLLFNDVTSLKSFDSLTGCGDIIADAEEEMAGNGGSGTSSSSSGGGGGVGGGGSAVGRPLGVTCPPTRGSPSKVPLSSAQSVFAASPGPASLPARARVPPAPQPPAVGSGVVAYMGGGEEMASPEGVDDADMQGLWHMLPSTGDNSPALPRSLQPACTTPTSTYPLRTLTSTSCQQSSTNICADRKTLQVKSLGLSKIPVVGGVGSRAAKPLLPHARHPASPGDKEALSDEGYWETPSATPTATPEESGQRHQMSRDSCSGERLYDFYNDPEGPEGDDDQNSSSSLSTEYKLSPPSSSSSSSFRSMKGSASLPRESKIPVSARQTPPPQSVSQSALSSVLEAELSPPKTQALPRTRIPVSKVPVRRPGNKPGPTSRASKK